MKTHRRTEEEEEEEAEGEGEEVVVGRGRRTRYVTPDLSYYWEGARGQCEDNKWGAKKKKNAHTLSLAANNLEFVETLQVVSSTMKQQLPSCYIRPYP